MHIRACLYTTDCAIFTVSVHEVSLRACSSVFATSVRAYLKVQIRSHVRNETNAIAAELRVPSHRGSEYAHSETLLSLRSLEYACSTRSFAWRVLEASTAPEASLRPLSKLRPTRMGQSFDALAVFLFLAETGRQS